MRFLIYFLALLPFTSSAQNVSGSVRDEEGQPMQNATIALKQKTAIRKFTLTDAGGSFLFVAPPADTLTLSLTATGYNSKDTVFVWEGKNALVLPPFTLQPSNQQLTALTVTASKPLIEVQPDKTVFNVSSSIVGSGGTALEVLQKSPGVLVDKDDNITMNAKSGVRIYIDGRPSPLSLPEVAALLRSLPAADVDAIEIITNPSARYEAAGNAGIINIRLKKNKALGTNGSLNAGYNVGILPKYNGGFTLNHRTQSLNLFGGYSYNLARNESYLNLFRSQNDSLYDQRSQTFSRNRSHNLKAGADWFINKQHTLGLLVTGNFSENEGRTNSRTPIAAQSNKDVVQTLEALTQSRRRRANFSTNLNYRFADTAGRVLSADADWSQFDLEGEAYTPNVYRNKAGEVLSQTAFRNRTPVTIQFYSLQASYESKLWGGKVVTGLRSASARTDNRFQFFDYPSGQAVRNGQRSNRFRFTEDIHAAFVQYNKQKGKWSYTAGLRVEATNSLGRLTAESTTGNKTVRRRYVNLFPTAGLTYQLHKDHQLGLSAGRRIDRPSYQDLNPFENRLDELTYQKGNPFLRPQFTNNIELKHTYRYKLSTSIGFSDVQDFFAQITDTTEGRRNFITQRNLARQRIWSLSSALPFSPTKWWRVYASAGVTHSRYRAQFEPGKEIRINATVANLYQQHSFTINKNWSGEISGFYTSPYVWAGTYECRAIWSLDAGLQRKVLKDQGTIRLGVSDIFRRMPWEGVSRLGALRIEASGGWESRLLRATFTYRFGNKEVKAAQQRSTGVDDLNRRVQ